MFKYYLLAIFFVFLGTWFFFHGGKTLIRNRIERFEFADYFLAKIELVISFLIGAFFVLMVSVVFIYGGISIVLNPKLAVSMFKDDGNKTIGSEIKITKYKSTLLRDPAPNSPRIATLKKGELVHLLYSFKSPKNNRYIPVIYLAYNKKTIKGWIEQSALRDPKQDDNKTIIIHTLSLIFKYEFWVNGSIDGAIGFILSLILSVFSYGIRKNILWVSDGISTAVVLIHYSILGKGYFINFNLLIFYFIPAYLVATLLSTIMMKVTDSY